MKKIFYIGLAIIAFTGCGSKRGTEIADSVSVSKTGKHPIRIEHLKSGSYGGRENAGNILIKSQQELDALYKELEWNETPGIDFTNNNVVALFMGQKSSGGYKIGIENITIEGNTAIVKVVHTSPDGPATMAITQPYFVAAINKTDKVVFK